MSLDDRRLDLAASLAPRTRIELRQLLDASEVVVQADPRDGSGALLAAAAVAAMAARVVGQVVTPPIPLKANPWGARTLRGVANVSRLERPARSEVTRSISVAVGRAGGSSADIYVGGDDWTAAVSRQGPLRIGRAPLGGAGLQAAAALAFGEVLKDLLEPAGMRCVRITDDLIWNLMDGQLGPAPLHRVGGKLTMPRVAFLGAGSVGSSAVAVLSMLHLVGVADVVDPDRFDPRRNAYRCPGVPTSEGGYKAEWAAHVLRRAGWVAQSHTRTTAAWLEDRPERGFPGVALVSVDNVDGRRDAEDLLAATTVSAGVSGAALHVHRHLPVDDLACPYCEFVDARRWRDQAEVYARLGLTVTRLQALLGGDPLTVDDVTTAIWAGSLDPGTVDDLPGGRLVDLLERHYAAVEVRLQGRGDPIPRHVSAPHVSWLAGTLLAAEVAKEAVGLPGLDRRVELDLTGVPLGGWRRPARDRSGRCPCTDPARQDLARAIHER